jgi:hypothetical protein
LFSIQLEGNKIAADEFRPNYFQMPIVVTKVLWGLNTYIVCLSLPSGVFAVDLKVKK